MFLKNRRVGGLVWKKSIKMDKIKNKKMAEMHGHQKRVVRSHSLEYFVEQKLWRVTSLCLKKGTKKVNLKP